MTRDFPPSRPQSGGFSESAAPPGPFAPVTTALRVQAPMVARVRQSLAASGLSGPKQARITGRVSPDLIAQAKARTGIETDSDLIEIALGNLALEDRFPEAIRRLRGSIDADIDLEF